MPNNQDYYGDKARNKSENRYTRNLPVGIKLRVCLFSEERESIESIEAILDRDTYDVMVIDSPDYFVESVDSAKDKVDCLVLIYSAASCQLLSQLRQINILLPLAIAYKDDDSMERENILLHPAEVKFSFSQLEQLGDRINLALSQFLNLTPLKTLPTKLTEVTPEKVAVTHDLLTVQQRRLTEKLKERLGYLGVYYKRSPQDFFRNLDKTEQEELNRQLATQYRQIILNYFEEDTNLNQDIDSFVDLAFFSDISISKILEIHMDLMDEFSQQLKLEGRSEEILLDYRLALIDIVAHLCEMYRRSIPRDDVTLDVFFRVD